MGTYSSYHLYIEDAPCHGVSANAITRQREFDTVEALYKAASVTDWVRRLYTFSAHLTPDIYIARVTRYAQPGWRSSRDYWIVLKQGTVLQEHWVAKMTLRQVLQAIYDEAVKA